MVAANILTPTAYIGNIMELCQGGEASTRIPSILTPTG